MGLSASWYFELAAVRTGGFVLSVQTRRPKAGLQKNVGDKLWSTTPYGYVCMDVKFVPLAPLLWQEEAELSRKRTRLLRAGTDLTESRASMVALRHDNDGLLEFHRRRSASSIL